MRRALVGLTLLALTSCATTSTGDPAVVRAGRDASAPSVASPVSDVAAERAANLGAYRFIYLPSARRLAVEAKNRWVAIAAGRVLPMSGQVPVPAATMEEADAAARAAAPSARHRFVFQVGEDGDVEWDLGGCELPHVLGTHFIAKLERDDVSLRWSTKSPSIAYRTGDVLVELASLGDANRTFVRPFVGAPGAPGVEGASYCVSTGFGGMATMSESSAAGLELWEIPGTARVRGAARSGDCRRARARFVWANTPLDFTVPVAIWPK